MKRPSKKKLATIGTAVAVGVAILSQRQPEIPEPETAVSSHTVYLPTIANDGLRRGYAWAWWNERERVSIDGVSWFYRWYPMPQESNPYAIEMVPMVKCDNQLAKFEDNYGRDYDGFVLWLNEPLSWNQCPMSPEKAYDFYLQLRDICQRCKLIGPQMEGDPLAREWFADFMSYSPNIDGIGLHHYCFLSWWENAAEQLSYYESYDLPVWVSELGCDDPATLQEIMQLYEDSGLVRRVAYFAPYIPDEPNVLDWPAHGRLFEYGRVSENMTPLGEIYLGR